MPSYARNTSKKLKDFSPFKKKIRMNESIAVRVRMKGGMNRDVHHTSSSFVIPDSKI